MCVWVGDEMAVNERGGRREVREREGGGREGRKGGRREVREREGGER